MKIITTEYSSIEAQFDHLVALVERIKDYPQERTDKEINEIFEQLLHLEKMSHSYQEWRSSCHMEEIKELDKMYHENVKDLNREIIALKKKGA